MRSHAPSAKTHLPASNNHGAIFSAQKLLHDRCFGCPNHGRFLGGKQQLSNFHHLLKTNRPRWWENCSFNHFGFVISTDFKVVWTHGRHVHLFAASTMATCFVQWPLSRSQRGILWCHWRSGGSLERRCFWGNLEAFTNKASHSSELDVSGRKLNPLNKHPGCFGDEFMIIYVACLLFFF